MDFSLKETANIFLHRLISYAVSRLNTLGSGHVFLVSDHKNFYAQAMTVTP